ncbi:hypothetical protein SAMN05216374_5919 [Tardiphaga sp. OK246]|uniref:hypothetical protein n=1 Tax=Tardiphaga sp. OK246 TaxID=1855307 RepID=UPI000B73551A|nr:hypothetical protein [Tardiphaga sp. OK246]SNT61545.1 hypothetical protein SAMN05216374_5919 [Tardiphaga sp. OK246]
MEHAEQKGAEQNYFPKTKEMRCLALARAYPLHLLLRADPDRTARLLSTYTFSHRKRRPNKGNTALIAVIIALKPANDDDYAACCEEAYALNALAERGVLACDFEREYRVTTIRACKEAVRLAKRIANPVVEKAKAVPAEAAAPGCDGTPQRAYFATVFVGPDGTSTVCKIAAPEAFHDTPIAEVRDDVFLAAYRKFLREALGLASPSLLLADPDDAAKVGAP